MRQEMIYQSQDNTCSLAVLKMLMVDASGDKRFKFYKPRKGGPYSLKDVETIAKEEGFRVTFKKVEDKEEIKNNTEYPLFVTFEENGLVHAVKVISERLGYFHIADPSKGRYSLSKKQFISKWTGVYGTIVREKEIAPSKDKLDLVPKKNIAVLLFVELIAISSLLAGMYFVDENGNYLVPVICFSVFAIMEIFRRSLSIRFMKKFDEKWLEYVFNGKNKKDAWARYHSLEKNIFASPMNLLSSIISSVSIVLIGGLNEPSFFLSAALTIGAVAIKQAFDSFTKDKLKVVSTSKEQELFSKGGGIEEAKEVKAYGYKYGSYFSYGQIITVFLVLCFAIIPLLHSGHISLNYYLFQFFGLFVLSSLLEKIFAFEEEYIAREKDLMYFYEYLS
ncbi:MAG: hypothetical protein IJ247_01670 [Bacilli bacterium]|nr:hypothetical protein [Bacilli bacterium]